MALQWPHALLQDLSDSSIDSSEEFNEGNDSSDGIEVTEECNEECQKRLEQESHVPNSIKSLLTVLKAPKQFELTRKKICGKSTYR